MLLTLRKLLMTMPPCFDTRCIRFLSQPRFKSNLNDNNLSVNLSNAQYFSHSSGFQSSLMPKNSQFTPPALPPKKQRIDSSNASLNSINSPPTSPKISNDSAFPQRQSSGNEETKEVFAESNEREKVQDYEKNDDNEPETVVLRKKPTEMVMTLTLIIVK